jgi:hypothetical protein
MNESGETTQVNKVLQQEKQEQVLAAIQQLIIKRGISFEEQVFIIKITKNYFIDCQRVDFCEFDWELRFSEERIQQVIKKIINIFEIRFKFNNEEAIKLLTGLQHQYIEESVDDVKLDFTNITAECIALDNYDLACFIHSASGMPNTDRCSYASQTIGRDLYGTDIFLPIVSVSKHGFISINT